VQRATTLTRFTKEGQAQIIEEHWKSLNAYDTDHRGVPLTTPGYSSDLERLVQGAGIGRRSGSRRTVWSTIDAVIARIVNAAVTLVERPMVAVLRCDPKYQTEDEIADRAEHRAIPGEPELSGRIVGFRPPTR
jgi:hypothetical protein